jgi:hypothetical protein
MHSDVTQTAKRMLSHRVIFPTVPSATVISNQQIFKFSKMNIRCSLPFRRPVRGFRLFPATVRHITLTKDPTALNELPRHRMPSEQAQSSRVRVN